MLAELPGPSDELGTSNLVRFTYERVWDYFVSSRILPAGASPSSELLAQLRDSEWRQENAGVVGLLITRCAEEGHGELADLISPQTPPDSDLVELFLDSLPWRTRRSVSPRTWELFTAACECGLVVHELDHLVPLAPNPQHPWNADWLHERLLRMPLAAAAQTATGRAWRQARRGSQ